MVVLARRQRLHICYFIEYVTWTQTLISMLIEAKHGLSYYSDKFVIPIFQ